MTLQRNLEMMVDDSMVKMVKAALDSRVAELLVAVLIVAMVLQTIAIPLQRIPEQMDRVILKLADLQQQLKDCNG
jgi:hypothetical protein